MEKRHRNRNRPADRNPQGPQKELDPEQQALNSLTRYLARRDHGESELRRKLGRRFEADVVDRVMERARAHRLLAPDAAVADSLTRALTRKMKSRLYIERNLRRRGLPVPPPDPDAELAKAAAILKRRWPDGIPKSPVERAKIVRYLKNRGFQDRYIRQILKDGYENDFQP